MRPRAIMEKFDRIWMGQECETCGRKAHCPDPRAAEWVVKESHVMSTMNQLTLRADGGTIGL